MDVVDDDFIELLKEDGSYAIELPQDDGDLVDQFVGDMTAVVAWALMVSTDLSEGRHSRLPLREARNRQIRMHVAAGRLTDTQRSASTLTAVSKIFSALGAAVGETLHGAVGMPEAAPPEANRELVRSLLVTIQTALDTVANDPPAEAPLARFAAALRALAAGETLAELKPATRSVRRLSAYSDATNLLQAITCNTLLRETGLKGERLKEFFYKRFHSHWDTVQRRHSEAVLPVLNRDEILATEKRTRDQIGTLDTLARERIGALLEKLDGELTAARKSAQSG